MSIQTTLLFALWPLLLYTHIPMSFAQSTTPQKPHCFSIHVRLNGEPVGGPQTIKLWTKDVESTINLDGLCFTVPSALLAEKELDVSFTVAGSKIHLVRIATGFFADPWVVKLADKKFGRDVSLPKHALAKEACAVTFQGGEPEIQIVQTGCRGRA